MAKKVTVKSKRASKAPQSYGRLVSKAPRNSGKTASGISESKNTINLKKVGVELQAESNTWLGHQALEDNTTGSDNTAVGFQALRFNTIGSANSCLGAKALRSNTSGSHNTATGSNALASNTSGYDNTAIGAEALAYNSTGFWNTAIGVQALFSNTGSPGGEPVVPGYGNTATGHKALFFNTTGQGNVANGLRALSSNTTASDGTACGNSALFSNTTGESNTAIGVSALASNTTGGVNTAVGSNALNSNSAGSFNTAIGASAGILTEATNSTFIGYGAGAFSGVVTNSTAVGSLATVTADNQVRIGNTRVTSIGGQVNFTAFSDGRHQENVSADVPGLAFIAKLRPITYTLDVEGLDKKLKAMQPQLPAPATPLARAGSTRSLHGEVRAGSLDSIQLPVEELKAREETVEELKAKQDKARIVYTGFVAQEVEQAAKELNYQFSGVDGPKNRYDFYGLRYAEFVVPLVKAVQELNAENKQVKKELSELRDLVDKLNKQVKKELSELRELVDKLMKGMR
jgi:trimeric autotransporter adhesin